MPKSIWALKSDEITEHLCKIQVHEAKGWLAEVIASVSHPVLTRVVVTLWAIWHARRKVVHGKLFLSPLCTHKFVEHFVSELELLNTKPKATKSGPSVVPRWRPPPLGKTKINVDTVVSKNSGISSLATVTRDSTGLLMGASLVVLADISDPETLEVLACRKGY